MGIDAKWRRTYVPKSAATSPPGTASLASSQVRRLARFDCVSRPVTEKLQVLQEGSQRIAGVVTGTHVGLPLKGGVFAESPERLVRGGKCIGPITKDSAMSMLEKNVVHQLIRKKSVSNLRRCLGRLT